MKENLNTSSLHDYISSFVAIFVANTNTDYSHGFTSLHFVIENKREVNFSNRRFFFGSFYENLFTNEWSGYTEREQSTGNGLPQTHLNPQGTL